MSFLNRPARSCVLILMNLVVLIQSRNFELVYAQSNVGGLILPSEVFLSSAAIALS